MSHYFGTNLSSEGHRLLELAARGQEGSAIEAFLKDGFNPTAAEYRPFVNSLIAIKAFDLASVISGAHYKAHPRSVEAACTYALAEVYCKRPDDAIKIAGDAMTAIGQDPQFYTVVGLAMLSVGSLENAGSMFQTALQMNHPPIAMAYLAEVLRLMGKADQAIACFDKCFASGCDEAEAYFLAGNAQYDAGQVERAISLLENALERKPHYLDAHDTLNKILWEHGHYTRFLKSFEAAERILPDMLPIRLRHAHFRIMAGKMETAKQQLEDCLAVFGSNARICAELATVSQQLNPTFDALPLFEEAYALDAKDVSVLKSFSRALIGDAQYERAAVILREWQAIEDFDQECLAYLATCNSHIDKESARRVNDYDELVQVFELTPPTGYATQADFNQALLRALAPLHRTDAAPIDQTLVKGTQTHGNLFKSSSADIKRLESQLRDCISRYIQHLAKTGPREIKDRISGNFEFSGAWSVQLSDGGYHVDHVHSAGWISSVYYVEVPDDLDDAAHEGWLKFGDTPFDPNNEGPQRFIKPVPGRLVLFPSYMLHGTVPIRAGKRRTTVAFDVVPC